MTPQVMNTAERKASNENITSCANFTAIKQIYLFICAESERRAVVMLHSETPILRSSN